MKKDDDCESNFFSTRAYWDERYMKELMKKPKFEWYFSYGSFKKQTQLEEIFRNKQNKTVLDLGCGSSNFAFDLVKDDWKKVIAIDFSSIVIEEMMKKAASFDKERLECSKNDLSFETLLFIFFFIPKTVIAMDATNMCFHDECFDVVIDKGTLDAICFCNNKSQVVGKLFGEINRVLRNEGVYICISSRSEEVILFLL